MITEVSPARVIAVRTLERIQSDAGSFAAETLSREIGRINPSDPDARLATMLVYGVLRNALLLDYQFNSYLKHGSEKLDPRVRLLFRMAAFQRFFLTNVPNYAIGNESVEMSRIILHLNPAQIGFVNAVVKRIVFAPDMQMPSGSQVPLLSTQFSHPEWLVRLLYRKFGNSVTAILKRNNEEPPMSLRVNTLRISPGELAARLADKGIATEKGEFISECLKLTDTGQGSALLTSTEFAEGLFYIQDEASMAVAYLANPQPGEHILDLCAAPGGKTTHMAELTGGEAHICCTDMNRGRVNLILKNLERLGTPGIKVRNWDGLVSSAHRGEDAANAFDLVLVDAPCSGLGTMRRNPEIRYRLDKSALSHHATQQQKLLAMATDFVKPTGRIVYSTCSVSDEENRKVILKFLADHPDWKVQKSLNGCGELARKIPSEEGYFATWPDCLALDGFEAVVLRRE